MNKVVARCLFLCVCTVLIVLSVVTPQALDDSNGFLRGFVNQELLSLLGVIVTITIASATNLHLELNKMEEAAQRRGFPGTRATIRAAVRWLLCLFVVAVLLVVAKPVIAPDGRGTVAALVNGASLGLVLFNVLVLWDLSYAALQLGPRLDDEESG